MLPKEGTPTYIFISRNLGFDINTLWKTFAKKLEAPSKASKLYHTSSRLMTHFDLNQPSNSRFASSPRHGGFIILVDCIPCARRRVYDPRGLLPLHGV